MERLTTSMGERPDQDLTSAAALRIQDLRVKTAPRAPLVATPSLP